MIVYEIACLELYDALLQSLCTSQTLMENVTLKTKKCHAANFVFTGGDDNDNQWRHIRHNYTSWPPFANMV